MSNEIKFSPRGSQSSGCTSDPFTISLGCIAVAFVIGVVGMLLMAFIRDYGRHYFYVPILIGALLSWGLQPARSVNEQPQESELSRKSSIVEHSELSRSPKISRPSGKLSAAAPVATSTLSSSQILIAYTPLLIGLLISLFCWIMPPTFMEMSTYEYQSQQWQVGDRLIKRKEFTGKETFFGTIIGRNGNQLTIRRADGQITIENGAALANFHRVE